MIRNTLVVSLVFLTLLTLAPVANAWQPAEGPLMTRWANDVSAENVWTEYPRPQMVRPQWTNLNGLWQYAIQDKSVAKPTKWDGEILVPFPVESALSGVMKPVQPEQKLWYRRTFELPTMSDDSRLLLQFGAVDWECTVWVNGTEVGRHVGGYDPFSFDITDQLTQGENEIVLSVSDPTDAGWQPRGKQVLKPHGIMYTAVTGIWQTAWLEAVPTTHIESLKIVPDVDRGVVSVTVNASADAQVQIAAVDGDDTVANKAGATGQTIELPIQDAKLWSPDAPNLYDLDVKLLQDGKTVDTVTSYFGMRKIHVAKDTDGLNRLMLNNEVVFQYGPLDQGWWPDGLYTPASDEAMKYDVVMTKKFGMNMARKHVKYECARWYYWCDKLGLLVWQDMPAGGSGKNDESKANFRTELKAMIDALHNFPSIVMWVPFNEGWGQHDTPEVVEWVENYDPTRPVNEASGWHDKGSGTVSDMHKYPGPGTRSAEEDRVVVLGEFGGLGLPVKGHTWQAEKNWGYRSYENSADLTDAYVKLLTAMRPLIGQGLSAAVYTQTSDVEIEVNGIMTYDRAIVKMDLDRIAEAARKLYLPSPIFKQFLPSSEQQPQQWSYTTDKPDDDWMNPDFDATAWKNGPAGFGTEGTPGTTVRTKWDTADIWIRRTFTIDSLPTAGELCLNIHHDEDAQVYLNGKLAMSLSEYTTSYTSTPLDSEAINLLKTGQNTIAIHCRQTRGGQYIDAGLSLIIERQ